MLLHTKQSQLKLLPADQLKEVSLILITKIFDECFVATLIQIRQLLLLGHNVYKERIYANQSKLLSNNFDKVQQELKKALIGLKTISLTDVQLRTLYDLIKAIAELASQAYSFIEQLPETNFFQRYLEKLNLYKTNFIKFTEEFSTISKKLNDRLTLLNQPFIQQEVVNQAEAFKEDEQKMCEVFEKKSYEKYTMRHEVSKNKNNQISEQKEIEEIVKHQVTSLQTYITLGDTAYKERRKRLGESLVVPAYELAYFEKLTQGPAGSVFLGEFRKQQVIIKTLEGIVGEKYEKELFNEIKIMANVRSKYLTQIYGIIWEEDFKCVIIEYMPKGSLYFCLGQYPFKLDEKKKLALDIAYGLHNLHAIEMIHGNLSSHNILLDEANRAKITDFSCVETRHVSLTSVKNKRTPIESLEWSAPEVICLHPKRTAQSDIYSFGTILWEIFTGKRPFGHFDKLEPIQRNSQLLEYLRQGNKESLEGIPPSIANIIQGCWSENPEERPSIVTIMEQLENYQPTLQDNQEMIIILQEAANKNNAIAKHKLGLCYLRGTGVEKNPGRAYELFSGAVQLGFYFSKLNLAIMCIKGIGTVKDKKQALNYYTQIIENHPLLVEKCPKILMELNKALFPPQTQLKHLSTEPSPVQQTPTQGRGMFDKTSTESKEVNDASNNKISTNLNL